jgi:hypothetical protein
MMMKATSTMCTIVTTRLNMALSFVPKTSITVSSRHQPNANLQRQAQQWNKGSWYRVFDSAGMSSPTRTAAAVHTKLFQGRHATDEHFHTRATPAS